MKPQILAERTKPVPAFSKESIPLTFAEDLQLFVFTITEHGAHELFLSFKTNAIVPGKQNLGVTCPKGKLEMKIFFEPCKR